MMTILKLFYPLFIMAFYMVFRFLGIGIGETENLLLRVILMPAAGFIIYLSICDLANTDDLTLNRIRWLGFAVMMILLSGFYILETIVLLGKLIV